MPRPRTSRIAAIVLAAGLGLTAAHGANHYAKKPIVAESKMPEGWECTTDRCTQVSKPKNKNSNFSSRTSLRVFEHKQLSEEYRKGKLMTEKQLIATIFDLPNVQAKLDLIEGFCFRFYVADLNGGHFDLEKMKKTVVDKRLRKVLENFMKNKKKLKYRKVLEIN
jgi:hypothetical protein